MSNKVPAICGDNNGQHSKTLSSSLITSGNHDLNFSSINQSVLERPVLGQFGRKHQSGLQLWSHNNGEQVVEHQNLSTSLWSELSR